MRAIKIPVTFLLRVSPGESFDVLRERVERLCEHGSIRDAFDAADFNFNGHEVGEPTPDPELDDEGEDECAACLGWDIFNALPGGEELGDVERCEACGDRKGIADDNAARRAARALGFEVDDDFFVVELPPGVDVESDPATWIEQARAALAAAERGEPVTSCGRCGGEYRGADCPTCDAPRHPCGHPRSADDDPDEANSECPACERLARAALAAADAFEEVAPPLPLDFTPAPPNHAHLGVGVSLVVTNLQLSHRAADIQIPEAAWQACDDGETDGCASDGRCRLLCTVYILGCAMHLEAVEVKTRTEVDGSDEVCAVCPIGQERFDALCAEYDTGAPATVVIAGRAYFLVATPFSG